LFDCCIELPFTNEEWGRIVPSATTVMHQISVCTALQLPEISCVQAFDQHTSFSTSYISSATDSWACVVGVDRVLLVDRVKSRSLYFFIFIIILLKRDLVSRIRLTIATRVQVVWIEQQVLAISEVIIRISYCYCTSSTVKSPINPLGRGCNHSWVLSCTLLTSPPLVRQPVQGGLGKPSKFFRTTVNFL
jgi:hypothetical protein